MQRGRACSPATSLPRCQSPAASSHWQFPGTAAPACPPGLSCPLPSRTCVKAALFLLLTPSLARVHPCLPRPGAAQPSQPDQSQGKPASQPGKHGPPKLLPSSHSENYFPVWGTVPELVRDQLPEKRMPGGGGGREGTAGRGLHTLPGEENLPRGPSTVSSPTPPSTRIPAQT